MTPLRPFARRGTALMALAVGLGLAACAPPPAPPPTVQPVFVTTVRNDTGTLLRILPGTLRPRVESELSFRAGGKVLARTVELGQLVRAGQVLGRIDATDYQLAVMAATEQQRAAEVDATQAASDAARFKRLMADGSVGAADAERQQARADAAAARLAQAQRQAELARNRAGYATLTAPFDGVVTALRFEAGQTVADNQPVLSLARPEALELQVDVPEALATELAGWQASATIGTAAQPIPLRLRELAPTAATGSRTFRARYSIVAVPGGNALRMGMTATLRLVQPGGIAGAELPVSALLATGAPAAGTVGAPPGDAATVWAVDTKTGALQRTPVQVVSHTTDRVRVAGLPDGALVVSVGAHKLDAGVKVQPVARPLDGPVAQR